jgi:hypothetical protein
MKEKNGQIQLLGLILNKQRFWTIKIQGKTWGMPYDNITKKRSVKHTKRKSRNNSLGRQKEKEDSVHSLMLKIKQEISGIQNLSKGRVTIRILYFTAMNV